MTIIALDAISFRRGDQQILAEVSWRIDSGQHWALLGANGSGKTTLLKIITGYEWVTDGVVEVLGETFGRCNLPELRKTIGWVSSALEHNLPEHDRAVEIVASGLEASIGLYRDFTAEEFGRARAALSLLGCEPLAERRYGLLSQGEKQRALIARAMVSRPRLLVLDEPCAGLDPVAREAFLEDLSLLASRPTAPAMVLVTHHIEEIGPWITHVLVLKAGRVLAAGPRAQTLTGETLGAALDRSCIVEARNGHFHLKLAPR